MSVSSAKTDIIVRGLFPVLERIVCSRDTPRQRGAEVIASVTRKACAHIGANIASSNRLQLDLGALLACDDDGF
jgi:hypothetical protein